jgi:hypothetical protein
MKKILLILALVFSISTLCAAEPQEIAEIACRAAATFNPSMVRNYMQPGEYAKFSKGMQQLKQQIAGNPVYRAKYLAMWRSADIKNAEIKGNQATVKVVISVDGKKDTLTMYFERVNGKWYLLSK